MDDSISTGWLVVIIVLAIWDIIWRGIALWRAGKNQQRGWFIALLLLNTVGILPLIYILFSSKVDKKD